MYIDTGVSLKIDGAYVGYRMAPTVESLGVSGIASKESARFTISREFKSARCELMMFESPTLHLGKTTSFYR